MKMNRSAAVVRSLLLLIHDWGRVAPGSCTLALSRSASLPPRARVSTVARPRGGLLKYHGHASNMHHSLCYPLRSFPVQPSSASWLCSGVLLRCRHQKPGVSFRRPPNLDPCLVLYQDSRHARQSILEWHLAGSGHVCVKDGHAILAVGDARHG